MTTEPTFVIEQPVGSLAIHDLTSGVAQAGAPVVLAVHGITSNGLTWAAVAEEVARRHGPGAVRFLAPDLRGRGASRDLPPPYGLRAHVEDLLSVATVFGARPLLVGHSMGAFVAALAVASQPSRFLGAVLVDGGAAFPPPPDTDIDAALSAVIGPAMDRLAMRFSGVEDYLAFWARHPALGPVLQGPHADTARRYLAHDLVEDGAGAWRSSCVLDAVRADGADVLADEETHAALASASAAGLPVDLIWAHRGLLDEPQGLYSSDRIGALGLPRGVRISDVDANHYDVILGALGVTAIVDAIDAQLGPSATAGRAWTAGPVSPR